MILCLQMKNTVGVALGFASGLALFAADSKSMAYGLAAFMIGSGIAIISNELLIR